MRNGLPTAIDQFQITAGHLVVGGQVQFTPEGDFQSARLDNLQLGRTQAAGEISVNADGSIAITLNRGTLDLEPFLDGEGDNADSDGSQRISIAASLDRVWLTEDGFLSQVSGTMQFAGPTWLSGRVDAASSSGMPILMTLDPIENGRFLRITADDAGSVLRDLDLVRSVRDGRLVIAARFRDYEEGKPLVGDIDLTDFRLVDAPLVAEVVSIAGITGISRRSSGRRHRIWADVDHIQA